MGAQQSGNATVPPAAPESETRTKVDSSLPRVDHRPPDVANFPSTTPPPGHPAGGGVGGGDAPVQEKKKLKPCCACPETKKIRDECIMQEGEENCQHLIEAHKACMRSLGFNI